MTLTLSPLFLLPLSFHLLPKNKQWGVIHTFVELVQNHSLLTKPFAQGVPEIERVYRSLVSGGGNMG